MAFSFRFWQPQCHRMEAKHHTCMDPVDLCIALQVTIKTGWRRLQLGSKLFFTTRYRLLHTGWFWNGFSCSGTGLQACSQLTSRICCKILRHPPSIWQLEGSKRSIWKERQGSSQAGFSRHPSWHRGTKEENIILKHSKIFSLVSKDSEKTWIIWVLQMAN